MIAVKFSTNIFLLMALAYSMSLSAQQSPAIADVNGDGRDEIISDGATCSMLVPSINSAGIAIGATFTTEPCSAPAGEYGITNPTPGQILPVSGIIADVVDGAGWVTTLVIVNTTASPASASLTCYKETAAGDGSTTSWNPPFIETSLVQNLSLAGGASIFLHTSGTNSALSQGFCQASYNDGVQIHARFQYAGAGQGTAPAMVAGNDVLVPVDNTGPNLTAIALVNPNQTSETVSVSFEPAGGNVSQSTISLPPLGHKAFLMPAQFPATANQAGQTEFYVSQGSVALIALQFNLANAFIFTGAPVYSVSNGPILGAVDPWQCLINPAQNGCAARWLAAAVSATYTPANSNSGTPLVINIVPGANGTYNAAFSGTINNSPFNGTFVLGSFSIQKVVDKPDTPLFTFTFTQPVLTSTFTSGSLTLTLTPSAYDSVLGEMAGTVSGSLAVNQLSSPLPTAPGSFTGTFAFDNFLWFLP